MYIYIYIFPIFLFEQVQACHPNHPIPKYKPAAGARETLIGSVSPVSDSQGAWATWNLRHRVASSPILAQPSLHPRESQIWEDLLGQPYYLKTFWKIRFLILFVYFSYYLHISHIIWIFLILFVYFSYCFHTSHMISNISHSICIFVIPSEKLPKK